MKQTLILIIALFLSLNLSAQKTSELKSEIKSVTVYQQGAQMNRTANYTVEKGKTSLVFKALPDQIDPKSIQVKAGSDIVIVSVNHTIDYLNKIKNTEVVENLKNKQKYLLDSIDLQKKLLKVFDEEYNMILTNKTIGGNNGLSVAELEKASNFFRSRLTKY
jgi:hypothetical protein